MRTYRSALTLLLAAGIPTFAASCTRPDAAAAGNPSGGAGTAVGVVDIDRIATDLQWMEHLQVSLTNLRTQLNQEVEQAKAGYDQQLRDRSQQLAGGADMTKLSDPAKQDLQRVAQAGQQTLLQMQQAAGQQFDKYRLDSVRQYREALAPIVKDVADAKKIDVVVATSDTLVYHASSTDLTQAVIDAAKAHPPTLTPLAIPHLPAPPALGTLVPMPMMMPPSSLPATQPQ